MKQYFNNNSPKIQKYDLNYTPPELSDKYKKFHERQNNHDKTPQKPNIEKKVWDSENFEWKTE